MGGEATLHVLERLRDTAAAVAGTGRLELADQLLGRADREVVLHDAARGLDLLGGLLEAEEDLGVAGVDLPLGKVAEHLAVELEETDGVGDGGAGLAEALGDGVLRQLEVAHQRGDAQGLVDRVEVGALQVLDEGEHGTGGVADIEDAGGDDLDAKVAERAQAALTGDELEALADLADDDRLDEALGPDGLRELLDGGVVKLASGLAGVGHHLADGHLEDARGRRGVGGRGGDAG